MGKSNTIKEQQEKNKVFQDYIDNMTQDMVNVQDGVAVELTKMEESHYEGFTDKALLVEGRYSHLTTVDEWSLKSVNAIIEACTKVLFGSKETPPEGSSVPKQDEKVSASIDAIKQRELYIASEAFAVVQSVIGGFNNATTTSVERKIDAKPIGPGMTMFIGVVNNAFTTSSFFKNEKIIQTIFVFKVCYSIEEGKKQSALSDLQVYEDQKQAYRNMIKTVTDKEQTLDPLSDDFNEAVTKLEDTVELLCKRLEAITKKINELNTLQMKQESDACRQFVERMHMKRDSIQNGGHQRTSSEFTCTESQFEIEEKIKSFTPKTAHLQSLIPTDKVGNHYKAVFTSKNKLETSQVDSWIARALTDYGNFHFD